MTRDHFGIWLRRAIEDLGISQREFARRVGVHFATIQLWFKMPRPAIRGFRLSRVANELGVSRDEIEDRFRATPTAA